MSTSSSSPYPPMYPDLSISPTTSAGTTQANSQITSMILPNQTSVKSEIQALSKEIQTEKNTILVKNLTRPLGVLVGVCLGVLTGLALAGLLVSPAGWAILGAAAVLSLAAAFYLGGPAELKRVVLGMFIGFSLSTPSSMIAGMGVVAGEALLHSI